MSWADALQWQYAIVQAWIAVDTFHSHRLHALVHRVVANEAVFAEVGIVARFPCCAVLTLVRGFASRLSASGFAGQAKSAILVRGAIRKWLQRVIRIVRLPLAAYAVATCLIALANGFETGLKATPGSEVKWIR